MGIGGSLLELGRFLDTCERRRAVESVDLAEDCSPGATGRMVADVELTLSTRPSSGGPPAVSLGGGSIDDDGRIQLALESVDGILPERPEGVDVELGDVTFDDDGRISVTLTASSTVEDGGSVAGTAAADGGARAGGHGGGAIGRSAGGTGPTPVAEEDGASPEWVGDGSTELPDGTSSDRPDEGSSDPVERGAVERDGDGSFEASERDSTVGSPADGADGRSDRSVPPFSDPDLLRDVYESCDTFAEMPDALGMDVTAETVRRYMIDHGIHEPDSYDTDGEEAGDDDATPDDTAADPSASDGGRPDDAGSDDAGGEGPRADDPDIASPVVLTDGIGLPEDVTVDTLVDVVQRSNTIYEVTTAMGIDREEAVEMLQRLDLAEYVTGRLALAGEREVTRDLVLERLQRHAEQT